jgi:hypothetical protein
MNPKIAQTENNIKIYEDTLLRLGTRLGQATDTGNLTAVRMVEAEIKRTQQYLKDEMELLDELKQK